MRYTKFAMTVGMGLLCTAAQARHHTHHHRPIVVIDTPLAAKDPSWPVDYNIVPRYRYRPQDDRVDPYGPPVALAKLSRAALAPPDTEPFCCQLKPAG